MFKKFVEYLIDKKVCFSVCLDAYNNQYISIGEFEFKDLVDCVVVSSSNLYAKCDLIEKAIFIYESIRN